MPEKFEDISIHDTDPQKEKRRFGCSGCLVVISCILILLLVVLGVHSKKSSRETNRRRVMAVRIKHQIEDYHAQHGVYPELLEDLPISNDSVYQSYLESKVFRYRTAKKGGARTWYILICVNDGLLRYRDGLHGLGWAGVQAGNNLKPMDGQTPDENGFIDVDLH